MAQLATLRVILALLHHWVFEVDFTRARFHPLHVDNNKTSLSTMGAVSQWLYTDLNVSCPPKGTCNDSSLPWPCCHPGSRLGDLEHPNTQHGHRGAVVRARVEEQEWAAEARRRAGKSCSVQAAVSQHVGFGDKTTSRGFSSSLSASPAFTLESMAPFCWLPSLLCKLHHPKTKH